MNKQIILEQCDKIKNVVTEATQNEEEARNNAEKFKGIKEENTKLLDLLNKTKDIYWEMERILRIIEIDKEYDNTDNELENLKINVKDLIDKLRENTAELEKYDSVKETVGFYTEALKDATDFISGNDTSSKKNEEKEEDSEVPFSFDDNNDFNLENISLDKEDDDKAFDFSAMYGFTDEDEDDAHTDKQKVVNITDFNADEDSEEKTDHQEEQETSSVTDEDNSLSELNDLFNYLNNDDSFNN